MVHSKKGADRPLHFDQSQGFSLEDGRTLLVTGPKLLRQACNSGPLGHPGYRFRLRQR